MPEPSAAQRAKYLAKAEWLREQMGFSYVEMGPEDLDRIAQALAGAAAQERERWLGRICSLCGHGVPLFGDEHRATEREPVGSGVHCAAAALRAGADA